MAVVAIARVPRRLRRSLAVLTCVAAGLLAGQHAGAQPVPLGDEFIVNSYTTEDQVTPAISSDAAGNFVVVWRSGHFRAPSSSSIRARRFDAAGSAEGTEFVVGALTSTPFDPAVSMTADGAFMVVWRESEPAIAARSFDADALPRGDAFRVDSTIYDYYHGYVHGYEDLKYGPDVSAGTDDEFMIVWSAGYNEYLYHVHRRRYVHGRMVDGGGTFVGDEFRAGGDLYYEARGADVETDTNGRFVVVWNEIGSYEYDSEDYYARTPLWNSYARRFDGTGTASDSAVLAGPASASDAAVATDRAGGFLVSWSHYDLLSGWDVRGRRYDVATNPTEGAFVASSPATSLGGRTDAGRAGLDVAVADGGSFVVVWASGADGYQGSSDGSEAGIFARTYAADGTPLGAEVAVNTFTTGLQTAPEVAFTGPDTFVVTWQSVDRDGSDSAIVARRFARAPQCGDASGDALTTATDALIALKTAVGAGTCPVCVCDTDNSGTTNATDALRILNAAVGTPIALLCSAC